MSLATNAGRKTYISSDPIDIGAELIDFTAANWLEIGNVGTLGETGTTTNLNTYNVMSSGFALKQKGISDAGSPTVECAYTDGDPGQAKCFEAAQTKLNYGLKFVYDDRITIGGTGSEVYNLGVVTGPSTPNGGVEDFRLDVYTWGCQQREIRVEAT